MMKFVKLFIFSTCAFLAINAGAQEMGPVNGTAQTGALLFYQHGCYGCHGYSGYGRKDLNNTGSPFLLNEQIFSAYLRARQDVAPLLPSTQMPNYPANALTDRNVSDIYAYVRSMQNDLPETGDVPTLQIILDSAERPYSP
jgi:mono/diheme cytochrome c family protein